MKYIDTPSPNFDERGRAVDMIILHYTGMVSCDAALERLCDKHSKVSAHYLVDETGRAHRLVPEEKRAWHAGVASWKGATDINARSIGIELANPGHEFGYRAFPEAQIAALIDVLKDIQSRHAVAPENVLGHADVAPRRKEDPGEKFPWPRLAAEGLALAPAKGEGGPPLSFEEARKCLAEIGYDAPPGDYAAALLAFQRRFCPDALGQGFCPQTKAALDTVRRALTRKD